jgi:hypothetical protein
MLDDSDEILHTLSGQVRSHAVTKESIGWSLDELEECAQDVQADSDDEDEAEVDAWLQPSQIS